MGHEDRRFYLMKSLIVEELSNGFDYLFPDKISIPELGVFSEFLPDLHGVCHAGLDPASNVYFLDSGSKAGMTNYLKEPQHLCFGLQLIKPRLELLPDMSVENCLLGFVLERCFFRGNQRGAVCGDKIVYIRISNRQIFS